MHSRKSGVPHSAPGTVQRPQSLCVPTLRSPLFRSKGKRSLYCCKMHPCLCEVVHNGKHTSRWSLGTVLRPELMLRTSCSQPHRQGHFRIISGRSCPSGGHPYIVKDEQQCILGSRVSPLVWDRPDHTPDLTQLRIQRVIIRAIIRTIIRTIQHTQRMIVGVTQYPTLDRTMKGRRTW